MIESRKLLVRIRNMNKSLFDISVEIQKKYLASFPEPTNDIERSYFQYKCQMLFNHKCTVWIQNIVGLLSLPFVAIALLFRSKPQRNSQTGGIIIEMSGINSTQVPDKLQGESFTFVGKYLKWKDLWFCVVLLCKYPLAPFFTFKTLFVLSQYRYAIEKYAPSEIVVHREYSFTSSAISHFCNMNSAKHINIMHGEKLFYIRDSFFRFDECYVWDEHYAELFIEMRAEKSQFLVSLPISLKIDTKQFIDKNLYADYKYYLTQHKYEELEKIVETMKELESKGYSVKLRPHHRYTDVESLERLASVDRIEYPQQVSIEQSIANTMGAISCYSTVLLQAHYAGKSVILDDITYKEHCNKLKELKYIITQKNFKYLTDEKTNL